LITSWRGVHATPNPINILSNVEWNRNSQSKSKFLKRRITKRKEKVTIKIDRRVSPFHFS